MNFLQYLTERQFHRFMVVGGFGFCVDGGLLTLLMQNDWSIISARSCSFSFAVSTTWLLNRLWTFDSGKRISARKEYSYYFITQILGALINLSIFFSLINLYPALRNIPLLPLAFGATVSMAFNYLVSKKIVFKRE